MSCRTYFMFAAGLGKPLRAPKGTLVSIRQHVEHVESVLKLKRTRYKDNPVHWDSDSKKFEGIDNETLCREVEAHNRWVRYLYDQFAEWYKTPVKQGEKITPEMATEFWHALEELRVEPERWDEEYYRARMESAYEVMRGRESEGETFEAKKPLTPEQASAVVLLFSQWLDTHDIRLCVPKGMDSLRASWDGGYTWSETCGAIAEEDVDHHGAKCRKKDCYVRELVRNDC